MYVVEHKFTKADIDITSHKVNIINIVTNKQSQLMGNSGFLGVNVTQDPSNTSFTISVFWENKQARDAANLENNNFQDPIFQQLQQYCFDNDIIYTKNKRKVT